ncbi:MAG: histidine kinase, partial [Sphingomicrobium sp.]
MRNWRASAAYRIAFANFGAYAIGLAALGAVVFGVMHVAALRQIDASAADEARTLVDEYRTGGAGELREAIAERELSASPSRMLYAVFAPDGRRIQGAFRAHRPRNL